MKLKRINQKFNTTLSTVCKNLNLSLEELVQAYDRESPGWGCFIFSQDGNKEYTFVHGDSENSECEDPEYGISYFIIRSNGGVTKLVEFGIAPNGRTENSNGPFKYAWDESTDNFLAHYHYGNYFGIVKSKWQEQVDAAKTKVKKLNIGESIPEDFTGIAEHSDGSKSWWLNGQYHRVDGPAIEYPDGTKEWRLNGKRHRVDGPANEWANGTKEWCLNGEYHCVDGPAVQRSDGTKHWYLNGKFHRADGPAIEMVNGTKQWYLNGKRHRVDGPAWEWANGSKAWYLNGEQHRVDGPAIQRADGSKEWWLNGKRFTEKEWEVEVSKLQQNCAHLTTVVSSATVLGSVVSEQNCQTRVEKMSKAETIKSIVLSDTKMVAQRVAVEKIAKVLQGLIVEGITRNSKGKNKTLVKTQLGEFFNTDQGRAAIKFLVGCLAPFVKGHVPEKYHGVIDEIATEARVQGETTAMLNIIDMVQPMIAMLSSTVMDSLQSFVATDEKVRVELDSATVPAEPQEVVFAASTNAATA